MSIYERPNPNIILYTSKFVRVGDIIAVTKPGDVDTSHKSLATTDGLLKKIEKLRGTKPNEIDAGTVTFDRRSLQKPMIILGGVSPTLDVPTDYSARQKTIELFVKNTIGYEVVDKLGK